MGTQKKRVRKLRNLKWFSLSIMIVLAFVMPGSVKAKEFMPDDLPTIEALIEFHKALKKAEESSMKKVSLSQKAQIETENISKKFNEVRTTLDSKIKNVYSYVILASAISTTAQSVYKAIDEYYDFSKFTADYVKKKPFTAYYFTNTNYQISKEVKRMKNTIGKFVAEGLNIMRAPLNDKVNMLMQLQSQVETIRGIIRDGRIFCELMVFGSWKPDYIWEILNSDVTDAIAKKIISEWAKNT